MKTIWPEQDDELRLPDEDELQHNMFCVLYELMPDDIQLLFTIATNLAHILQYGTERTYTRHNSLN